MKKTQIKQLHRSNPFVKTHPVADFGDQCKWSTPTSRQWLGNICNCKVVECRCPSGLADALSYGTAMTSRIRHPVDTNGNAVTDAGYYEVRSGYCNARYCQNFES